MNLDDNKFFILMRNRTFARLFSGRIITDTGDSLYYVATMWLVWELTGSAFYTGVAGALVQAPTLLSFLIGPLADRWQLRPILLGTQLINGVGVLLVPVAAAMDLLSVWIVLVLVPILSLVNEFVYPAQNAALPQIIEEDLLPRANSLTSTTYRAVDTAADALGGFLISAVGAISMFYVNSVTFFAAAALFIGVTVQRDGDDSSADTATDQESEGGQQDDTKNEGDESDRNAGKYRQMLSDYLGELRVGFRYLKGSTALSLILVATVVNFSFAVTYPALPAYADQIGGPATYGLLLAAIGAGNAVGGAGAFLVEDYSLSNIAMGGFGFAGVAWIAALQSPNLMLTLLLLFVSTLIPGAYTVLFFSLLQTSIDTDILGRVSSLARTLVVGLIPLGAILGGTVASIAGSETVMYAVGVGFVSFALLFLLLPDLRRLPPVTDATESTLNVGVDQ